MKEILTKRNLYYFAKELVWLSLTAVLVVLVLKPITRQIDFKYWKVNAVFIAVSVTYFRYSITFKSIPFLKPAWVRFVLFAFNFSFFIYLMREEQLFFSLYDNFYTEDFGYPKVILYDNMKEELFRYLYREVVFFGTGSLVMIMAFQFRLILSYWQYYKRKSDSLLEG